ncbi:flagellin N-methylase [Caballeronia fortuita]|uniref:Flagellin N-methylase n=2 Tax=Caballeronia fortuita TaxID=1777138 RepID=A0A158C9D4_9BURK|nr:flagellin N-methylase [Caballeronia fortuita]
MSLRELFEHRDVFVGCIALGRVSRDADAPPHAFPLDNANAITITMLALDYPSLGRCPALAHDGLCSLHAEGKPDQCIAVPLDPLVPDRLQHAVLAQRSHGAGWIGAQCIQPGEHAGTLLLRAGEIVDEEASAAVQRRRHALSVERELWAASLFDALKRDFADPRRALAMLPADGYRTIASVPALIGIGTLSTALARACIDYIDAQTALINRNVAQAVQRRRLDDRPTTQTLRGFSDALLHAGAHLRALPERTATSLLAKKAEAWLLA